jgi:hypothetical protein
LVAADQAQSGEEDDSDDELDQFVGTVLIQYTRGDRRMRNPAYLDLQNRLAKARRRGDRAQARTLRRHMVSLPSSDPDDPGYRSGGDRYGIGTGFRRHCIQSKIITSRFKDAR